MDVLQLQTDSLPSFSLSLVFPSQMQLYFPPSQSFIRTAAFAHVLTLDVLRSTPAHLEGDH